MHEALRELDLDITGYAISCDNQTADEALNTDEIRDEFEHVHEFDLTTNGEEAVEFLTSRHNFTGNVFLILRNFADADEEVKEDVSMHVKGYHEKHFFSPDTPRSLLLITDTDYPLNRHDSTLSGRVKYID